MIGIFVKIIGAGFCYVISLFGARYARAGFTPTFHGMLFCVGYLLDVWATIEMYYISSHTIGLWSLHTIGGSAVLLFGFYIYCVALGSMCSRTIARYARIAIPKYAPWFLWSWCIVVFWGIEVAIVRHVQNLPLP